MKLEITNAEFSIIMASLNFCKYSDVGWNNNAGLLVDVLIDRVAT